jgi:hypothetical protein
MNKLTLLEITQDVLNDISGDEVLSINDTVESVQVASIVRATFLDMMTNRSWPHTKRLIQLHSTADTTIPVYMTFDVNVKEIILVNYDKSRISPIVQMGEVKWINPEDFLRLSAKRNWSAPNIVSVTDPYSGIELQIDNSNPPTYFTSFDDVNLVFDSWDSSFEPTLTDARSQAYAYVMPAWTHEDSAIPDLPIEAFPQLIEESKSRSALKLRQQADQKSEEASQRSRRWLARKDWTVAGGIQFPNYGRNRRSLGNPIGKDPTFRRDN